MKPELTPAQKEVAATIAGLSPIVGMAIAAGFHSPFWFAFSAILYIGPRLRR